MIQQQLETNIPLFHNQEISVDSLEELKGIHLQCGFEAKIDKINCLKTKQKQEHENKNLFHFYLEQKSKQKNHVE